MSKATPKNYRAVEILAQEINNLAADITGYLQHWDHASEEQRNVYREMAKRIVARLSETDVYAGR